jgi:hypothetical protein
MGIRKNSEEVSEKNEDLVADILDNEELKNYHVNNSLNRR